MLILVAAIAVSSSPQVDLRLSGRYVPDFTKARGKNRHILPHAYPGSLYLQQNGQFTFPVSQREGYWHVSHGRVVLMFDSIFAMRLPTPTALLKLGWPNNELEGLVLQVQPDGILKFNSSGALGGPIIYHQQYAQATLSLLRNLVKDENDMESFIELWDQADARWPELLSIANDPDTPYRIRSEAAGMLPPSYGRQDQKLSRQNIQSILNTFEHLNTRGLTEPQKKSLFTVLARKICTSGYEELAGRVFAKAKSYGIKTSRIFSLMGDSRYSEGVPELEMGTNSTDANERQAACAALEKLDSKSSLPTFTRLTNDKDEQVRFHAEVAIAKLSEDPLEQRKAMKSFMKLLRGNPFREAIIAEALGITKSRLALPYLVNMLENGSDEFGRRTAAQQLGDLGFPEAVPALIQAKLGSQQPSISFDSEHAVNNQAWWVKYSKEFNKAMSEAVENSPTRQAAAEALWKFDQKHANKS